MDASNWKCPVEAEARPPEGRHVELTVLAFKGATNPKAGEGHKDRVSLQTLTQCLMEIMGPQCECLAIVSVFSSASWGRIEEWLPALY